MTTQRKDGKKPNKKADTDMVAIVKSLMDRGIPASMISSLYGIAPSTAYMWAYGERQVSIPKAPMQKALIDATKRFHLVLGNSGDLTA